MGKVLYVDGVSGASGDMFLGAMVDLGVPLETIAASLGSLALAGVTLEADRVMRGGVAATHVRVLVHGHRADHGVAFADAHDHAPDHDHHRAHAHDAEQHHGHSHAHDHDHHPEHGHLHGHAHEHGRTHPHAGGAQAHRSLSDIDALVSGSALSPGAQRRAMAWLARLAEAEAEIHGLPVDRVHLHEVGAVDSIADIVGAVCALEHIGADRVVCAPLNVGGGSVRCAHGVLPVPAPATLRLLAGVPTYSAGPRVELLTPTGALVLTGAATEFGPQPAMRISAVGYGAGDRDFSDRPNVLRAVLGDDGADDERGERLAVVECELDDMNPQLYGDLMDMLLASGVADVYFSPVQMKKNRPGTLITVLVTPASRDLVVDRLFAETTTLGVRYHEVRRETLEREHVPVATPFGDVRMKVGRRAGRVMNAAPEFDDCRRLARERGVAVKLVQAAAIRGWLDRSSASH